MPADPAPPAGFTLVEVLVALAIFSLAALALLRLQGGAMTSAADLDARLIAGIVARNQAIEAVLVRPAPAFGETQGDEDNAGRRWHWVRRVERTPDIRLQRIEITVMGNGARAATLVVRRAS